jgi:hypothetical protein
MMSGLGWLFGKRRKQAPDYKPPGDSFRQPTKVGQLTTDDFRVTASAHRRDRGTRWIRPDETVRIAGLSIEGGMVYLGPTERRDRAWRSTIDPSIQVARRDADHQGALMPYWPSYAEIDPRSRLAYLQWLASGRSDPTIGLGHVFLFFYGLERRLFADEAYSDLPMLVAEVERLRGIYDDNRSFRRYSGHFLEAAHALQLIAADDSPKDEAPPLDLDNDWELPLTLRIGLGRRIAARQTLTADWVLSWYLSHPETRLRTPAIRAFDQFCLLFRRRFDSAYPEGMRMEPDPVHGSPSPKQQEAVALFKLPETQSDDHASGPAYAAARVVLSLPSLTPTA